MEPQVHDLSAFSAFFVLVVPVLVSLYSLFIDRLVGQFLSQPVDQHSVVLKKRADPVLARKMLDRKKKSNTKG